jgi:hypothetical protein
MFQSNKFNRFNIIFCMVMLSGCIFNLDAIINQPGGSVDMQSTLERYLNGEMNPPDLTITYTIGDAFSGETYLRLSGDGRYEVWSTAVQGRQRKEYAGQLEKSEVETLVQLMLDNQLWTVSHVRSKPGEDDPLSVIQVSENGRSSQVELWVSEIRQVPAFDNVQEGLLAIVKRVSDGEVLEAGR